MTTPKRNVAIQWLRALAAIEVMIWHSDLAAKGISDWSIQTSGYGPLGGIGVEMFFVVSGYLMSLITSKSVTTQSFLKGRAFRIVPLYWFFTTLVVVAFLVNADWHLGRFDPSVEVLVSSYLLLPQAGFPILGVGWTLEYEVVFYAAVALFLWVSPLFRPSGRSSRRSMFALGMASIAFVSVVFSVSSKTGPWVNHVVTPYLFAFGYGWLVQILVSGHAGLQRWHAAGFALLFASAFAFADGHDALMLKRMALASGLVTLLLWLPALRSPRLAVVGLFALIGEASYSLYLSHWFVLSVFGKLVGTTSLPASADPIVRLVGLTLALVLGFLLYRFVERPLDERIRGGGPARSAPEHGALVDGGAFAAGRYGAPPGSSQRQAGGTNAGHRPQAPIPSTLPERSGRLQFSKEDDGASNDRIA